MYWSAGGYLFLGARGAVGRLERFPVARRLGLCPALALSLGLARWIRSRCSKSILKSFPSNSSSPPIRSQMSFKRSKTDTAAEKPGTGGEESTTSCRRTNLGMRGLSPGGTAPASASARHAVTGQRLPCRPAPWHRRKKKKTYAQS